NLSVIVMTPGKSKGTAIPVTVNPFRIGRDPQCHLRPATHLVSRQHCKLLVRHDRAFLKDFHSTNGTIINGRKLRGAVELRDGDQIEIGPILVLVRMGKTAAHKPEARLSTFSSR